MHRLSHMFFGMFALFAWTMPASAAWQRADSAHFTVYADASADWTRDYVLELERFDMLARDVFALAGRESGMKLTVFVLNTPGEVRSAYGEGGGNVGGFYSAAAGGALMVVPKSTGSIQSGDIVLRHEYAHHLMMQYFPAAYPAWYVEGFADFLSTASFDKQNFASLGTPPVARWAAVRNGASLSMEQLLTVANDRLNPIQRGALYAEGWLLTHYLTVSGERTGQLSRYLDLINDGKSPHDAAIGAFGPLDRLQYDFDRYRKLSRLNYFRLQRPFVYGGTVKVDQLDGAGQETMREQLALARGIRSESRLALAMTLEKVIASHPDSAPALAMLAQARLGLGDYDETEAAADKALAIDPNLSRAALWRGLAGTARLRKAGNKDAEAWKAARAYVVRANRAAPDDALPLYENYRIYRDLGMEPSPVAAEGLARAFQLYPQHVGIRFTYARLLAHKNEGEAAIRVLGPIANAPHQRRASEDALRMIAAIRAGQQPEGPPAEKADPDDESGD